MSYTIAEIGASLGAEVAGDGDLTISRASEPATAGMGDLALAMSPKYADNLGQAEAAILWTGADWQGLGLKAAIFVARPRMALSGLTSMMDTGQGFGAGVHPSAIIDPSAEIGADVSIGPFCVIGARARIGAGAVIGPQCSIGQDVVLGDCANLREMVSIGARVRIGARFRAQPGARIGADGFSYVTPEESGVEVARKTMGGQGDSKPQSWLRIHSLGAVQIGDDVEVGANCTIDYGTIRDTVIGDGCKLDNQVHLGHNVKMGRDCLIAGQSGLSGSVTFGNSVVMGGQSGVADNTFVGDNVIISGATKVLSNVPAGRVMMGYPAVKMTIHTEIYKAQRRLPRLMRDITALKKAVFGEGSDG